VAGSCKRFCWKLDACCERDVITHPLKKQASPWRYLLRAVPGTGDTAVEAVNLNTVNQKR